MTRGKLIETLRKLQQLGSGSSLEAKAARAKLRQLMARYGIEARELKSKPAAGIGRPAGERTPTAGQARAAPAEPVTITVKAGGFRFRWRL